MEKQQKDKRPWPTDEVLAFFALTRDEWEELEKQTILERLRENPVLMQQVLKGTLEELSVIVEEEGV